MRIGFFTDTYTPQINGVVTSIRLFKRALEERGHEVYIFAPDHDHHEDSEVTIRFPSMPFLFQKEMRLALPLSIEALRVLDRVDFDIIHSHDPFSIGLFGLNVARRHKVPYVHTYHTLYPEYVHYVWETRLTKRLAEVLSREFCDACDTIVAPSTKVERYLRGWGVKRPIDVIATGIDVVRYSTPDVARVTGLRERLALPGDERILLFMGRLGREKNVELLLRALWHSRMDGLRLLIVGDGPHRAELEELAEELDVTSRVTFAGYLERDDAIAAYHLSDAFGFGSTTETQGLVIGEALAAGLPVIAVDDPATCDFVI
ncbi:MAG: glycosyltransferase, partial [Actinomycetota bacterium]|nr:glycosyltransferase [Actinomycetota bacterium]